jgi:hypothetical protein
MATRIEANIGHQVEIKGDLKGALTEGEIKLDRDNWMMTGSPSAMKANVPNPSIFPASRDDDESQGRRAGSECRCRARDSALIFMPGATLAMQQRGRPRSRH